MICCKVALCCTISETDSMNRPFRQSKRVVRWMTQARKPKEGGPFLVDRPLIRFISSDEYYLTSITFLDSSAVFWIFGMFTFRTPFSTCALMFSLSAFSGRTIVCWNCE